MRWHLLFGLDMPMVPEVHEGVVLARTVLVLSGMRRVHRVVLPFLPADAGLGWDCTEE